MGLGLPALSHLEVTDLTLNLVQAKGGHHEEARQRDYKQSSSQYRVHHGELLEIARSQDNDRW